MVLGAGRVWRDVLDAPPHKNKPNGETFDSRLHLGLQKKIAPRRLVASARRDMV